MLWIGTESAMNEIIASSRVLATGRTLDFQFTSHGRIEIHSNVGEIEFFHSALVESIVSIFIQRIDWGKYDVT